jgi:hypothetical protein
MEKGYKIVLAFLVISFVGFIKGLFIYLFARSLLYGTLVSHSLFPVVSIIFAVIVILMGVLMYMLFKMWLNYAVSVLNGEDKPL